MNSLLLLLKKKSILAGPALFALLLTLALAGCRRAPKAPPCNPCGTVPTTTYAPPVYNSQYVAPSASFDPGTAVPLTTAPITTVPAP